MLWYFLEWSILVLLVTPDTFLMYSLRRRYRGFFKSSFPSVTEAIFGQAEVFFLCIILSK